MALQTFNSGSKSVDRGQKLSDQELSQLFIRSTKQTGYEWEQKIQYQTVLEIGTLYSEGFINKEVLSGKGTVFGSATQNWKGNKGNVYEALLPIAFNLQIADVTEFISAPMETKAAQISELAKFYTETSHAAIKTKSTLVAILRSVRAEAKSKGLIVEDFDALPLDPTLYTADVNKQQTVQAFVNWFGANYGQQLQALSANYSLASLMAPGKALYGYALYKKVNYVNQRETITYRFYKEG